MPIYNSVSLLYIINRVYYWYLGMLKLAWPTHNGNFPEFALVEYSYVNKSVHLCISMKLLLLIIKEL